MIKVFFCSVILCWYLIVYYKKCLVDGFILVEGLLSNSSLGFLSIVMVKLICIIYVLRINKIIKVILNLYYKKCMKVGKEKVFFE